MVIAGGNVVIFIFILFFNIPNSHRGVGVVPYGPEAASLAAA
jgi:hypothetical protein